MITLTYGLSGLLMIAVAVAFEQDLLSAVGQTIGWMIVFFIASPAASSAYLTVSETFPIEIRAMTIAIFYAIGTGVGGVAAPLVFGKLIESGSRQSIFGGYVFAALLMFAAAVIAWLYAVNAERRSLEEVAAPLSAVG
jgi:MFS family permease